MLRIEKKHLMILEKKIAKELRIIRFHAQKAAIKGRIIKRRLSANLLKGLSAKIDKISSERLFIILERIKNAADKIENSNMDEEKMEKLLDILAELEELIIEELDDRGENEDDTDESDLIDEIFSDDDSDK